MGVVESIILSIIIPVGIISIGFCIFVLKVMWKNRHLPYNEQSDKIDDRVDYIKRNIRWLRDKIFRN